MGVWRHRISGDGCRNQESQKEELQTALLWQRFKGDGPMKFTLYTANCTGNAKNSIYPNQADITNEEETEDEEHIKE